MIKIEVDNREIQGTLDAALARKPAPMLKKIGSVLAEKLLHGDPQGWPAPQPSWPPRATKPNWIAWKKTPAALLSALATSALLSCSRSFPLAPGAGLSAAESQMLRHREQTASAPVLDIESAAGRDLLEQPSRRIAPDAPGLPTLFAEMERTARQNKGMGIAAVQLGIPVRAALLRREDGHGEFQAFVNPEITAVAARQDSLLGTLPFRALGIPLYRTPGGNLHSLPNAERRNPLRNPQGRRGGGVPTGNGPPERRAAEQRP